MSVPFKIYCIWIGPYEMTEPRKRCLKSIRATVGVPVEVITNDTLEDYILPDYPLHKGFQYLSGTTQCDYLRTYIMHHYGCGYTDIKLNFHSWVPYFEALSSSPSKYVHGYREVGEWGVASLPGEMTELQRNLKTNWMHLLGNGAFICKPNTPFTREWMNRLTNVMDSYYPDLITYPAQHQRDYLGKPLEGGELSKFPIRWAGIAGAIFHPLCLNMKDHILYDLPPVNTFDYY